MEIIIPDKGPTESWNQYHLRILNNFSCNFPWGNDPIPTEYAEGYYLSLAKQCGWEDKPHGTYDSQNVDSDYYRSDLKASMTRKQFAEKILEVTKDLGIDIESFKKKLNSYHFTKVDEELTKEVCLTLIKVYRELRRLGYSHQDLSE